MKKSPPDVRQYFKDLKKRRSETEGKLKVAGYIRLSREAQKEKGYDHEQKAAITEFLLERLGEFIEPVRFYEDVDVRKGELAPHRRPGLMMALNSGIDKLVAMNVSRFGDETCIEELVELAHGRGVGLITLEQITPAEGHKRKVGFLRPGEYIDSQVDEEAFIERARGLRLQDERRKEKTQKDRSSKMNATRAKGLGIGGKPFYGYDWERKNAIFKFNKQGIKVVRFLFKSYVFKRMSLAEIAYALEKANVPPPKGSAGDKWYESTISDILKNPAYKGLTIQGGLKYPPAVDPMTWERAQYRYKKSIHTLSNMVWCRSCNRIMGLRGNSFYCTECKKKVNKEELLDEVWKLVKKDIDKKLAALTDLKKLKYADRIKERIGIKKYGKDLIIKNWIPVELGKKVWIHEGGVNIEPVTLGEFIEIIKPQWK